MSCGCGNKTQKPPQGVCDVCRWVDNDTTLKDVTYCKFCTAWICKRCEPDYPRRALAFLKRSNTK